jgi:hypothetical protein
MSYGTNQPWGLQAIKTINGGTWNGQTSQYLIKSDYAFNIFKGDLVFLGDDGYIHNLGELGNNPLQTRQALGVFNGCSFQTSVATNPIDPASPGRAYWPAGTVTFNSIDATCDIIDDPNVIYNIQSDAAGVPFLAQGKTAAVTYTYISGTNPSGNTNTGASSVVLNTGTIGENNFNLKIIRFVPVAGNVPVGNGNNRVPFNNVEVLIQNHSYAARPVPVFA